MTAPDHRTVRNAWIPWIVALVAVFGFNALAQDHSRSRKSESPDEIAVSLVADDAQASGRVANPAVDLDPIFCEGMGLLNLPAWFPRMESAGNRPFEGLPEGAVRGRAPPWMGFC